MPATNYCAQWRKQAGASSKSRVPIPHLPQAGPVQDGDGCVGLIFIKVLRGKPSDDAIFRAFGAGSQAEGRDSHEY
jgi:hypothetical protein